MQIKNEMSRADAVRNGGNKTLSEGGIGFGFCWLHDTSYRLLQGDETCPRCDKCQAQDLAWRDEEDAHYTSGDNTGDSDEE